MSQVGKRVFSKNLFIKFGLGTIIIGALVSTSSLHFLLVENDWRQELKYLGAGMIGLGCLVCFLQTRIKASSLWLALGLCLPQLSWFLSDWLNTGLLPISSGARFVLAYGCCLAFLLNLARHKKFVLHFILNVAVFVAAPAFIFSSLDPLKIGNVPFLDVKASRSFLFEVNVFAISCYLGLISVIVAIREKIFKSKVLEVLILLQGIFFSYYRFVYFFGAMLLFRNARNIAILSIVFILFVFVFQDRLWAFLETNPEFATLSGRDFLWSAAIQHWSFQPIFGMGEESIPIFLDGLRPRTPQFTSYHSALFDSVAIAGLVGLLSLVTSICLMAYFVGWRYFILLGYVLAPMFFNTFLPFSPNIIGVIAGALIIVMIGSTNQSRFRTI